jgi:RHS repeat-associated protein
VLDGDTTWYPFPSYEVKNGVATKHIAIDAEPIAKRVGTTTYWLHGDHLGSIQAVTDATGPTLRRSYDPFGSIIAPSTSHAESHGFIGELQDANGISYLNARYYDSSTGLFLSPDPSPPFLPGVGTNRYAYAMGDPINAVDHSGLDTEYPGSGGPSWYGPCWIWWGPWCGTWYPPHSGPSNTGNTGGGGGGGGTPEPPPTEEWTTPEPAEKPDEPEPTDEPDDPNIECQTQTKCSEAVTVEAEDPWVDPETGADPIEVCQPGTNICSPMPRCPGHNITAQILGRTCRRLLEHPGRTP